MNIETGHIVSQQNSLGTLWIIGWLFTIGYLKLSFWKGVLAFIIWPYYLGVHFRK
ncbi:MAG: hypothetical protein K9M11_00415 [Candidatus Pacebacteria bacterium]|nr:hypothetical protein [Candidatus Paceibacterota bacterium]